MLRANVAASVLLIPGAVLVRLVEREPSLGLAILRVVNTRHALATAGLAMMHVRDPEDRVMDALRMIDLVRGLREGSVSLLADHVGLRRETVSRALSSLKRKGLVRRSGAQITWVAPPASEREVPAPEQIDAPLLNVG